jgi:hypothetical protein
MEDESMDTERYGSKRKDPFFYGGGTGKSTRQRGRRSSHPYQRPPNLPKQTNIQSYFAPIGSKNYPKNNLF